tara:strand:+ start:99 stop:629 length:531 start_codon:yes stop_codon:yes gene_type:complete
MMGETMGELVPTLEEEELGQEQDKNKELILELDREREALLTIGLYQDLEAKLEDRKWMDMVANLIVTNNMPRARCSKIRINSNNICLHLTRIGNKTQEDITMDMIKCNQLLRIEIILIHKCKLDKVKDHLIATSNMLRTSSSAKSIPHKVLVNNKCLTINRIMVSKTCITLNHTIC